MRSWARGRWLNLGFAAFLVLSSAAVWGGGWEAAAFERSLWLNIEADIVGSTDELLQGHAALARMIASASLSAGGGDRFQLLLAELVRQHPGVHDILISDEAGHNLAEAHRDERAASPRIVDALSFVGAGPGILQQGPLLTRTGEAAAMAPMLGVGIAFQPAGGAGAARVTLLTLAADLPSSRSATGRAWLVGDDGVVIAAPGGIAGADAATDRVSDWAGLREMRPGSGDIRLAMADGAHDMIYRRLEPWPATLVVDTGVAVNPLLQPHRLVALALGLSGLFFFWRGAARPARRQDHAAMRDPGGQAQLAGEDLMRSLAASVAHRFNNILTVLTCDADMLAEAGQGSEDMQLLSRSMLGATGQGAALTQLLLSFAERAALRPQAIEIETLLLLCHDRLVSALDPDQTLLRVGPPGEAARRLVHVDPAALEQCLVLLLRNAADASGPGGEITLEADIASRAGVQHMVFVVDDSGPGMERGVLAQALVPGYSAHPGGRHLGLGLSAANGFARQCGGTLELESTPGLGTRARLSLPLVPARPQGEGEVSLPAPPIRPMRLGVSRPRRILLVEDSVLVRDSIARRLRADGFVVVTAATMAEVQAVVTRGVDVMLADIVLGDAIDGWTLALQAREVDPSLPLIFMSGYLSSRQPELLAGDDLASFVRKPVNGPELHTVIAGLLALRETRALQAAPRQSAVAGQEGTGERA